MRSALTRAPPKLFGPGQDPPTARMAGARPGTSGWSFPYWNTRYLAANWANELGQLLGRNLGRAVHPAVDLAADLAGNRALAANLAINLAADLAGIPALAANWPRTGRPPSAAGRADGATFRQRHERPLP